MPTKEHAYLLSFKLRVDSRTVNSYDRPLSARWGGKIGTVIRKEKGRALSFSGGWRKQTREASETHETPIGLFTPRAPWASRSIISRIEQNESYFPSKCGGDREKSEWPAGDLSGHSYGDIMHSNAHGLFTTERAKFMCNMWRVPSRFPTWGRQEKNRNAGEVTRGPV